MVLKANNRRTSCPCHDDFRGPRSDYVRQIEDPERYRERHMSDAEIIAAVTVNEKYQKNDENLNVESTVRIPKISNSERLNSVDAAISNNKWVKICTYRSFDLPTRQGSKVWVFEDDPTPTMVKRQRAMYGIFFGRTGLGKAIKLEGQNTVTANWYTINVFQKFPNV
ncbi:uncharacterized protein TNCV_2103831 [Trichonephila clavipes]|nr:uncharacterized protein TNCV_2103831 [Trichonephila clavipes]